MDEQHCVSAKLKYEFARFKLPQINAVTTSFLYVLPPSLRPGRPQKKTAPASVETTVQNYNFFTI